MLSFVRGVESRDIWVKMAYVMRDEYGELAFDAWDQWSQGAPNYSAKDARDVWKSCKGGSGPRATIGALIALAKEGGYRATAQDRKPVDPEELKRLAEERAARLAVEQAERAEAVATAAAKAAKLWEAASPDRAHPYLARKQIPGTGARVVRDQLLVPMRHGPGPLVGLQVIQADGSRKFLTGTPASGAYMTLGKPARNGWVVICEGYATGVSIHMATGYCVVVAFSAGNLQPVAAKIRAALPAAVLVLAADDDFQTAGNPGVTAAHAAAAAVSGLVAVPRWIDDRGEGTDFNDLHLAEGLDAVRQCFEDPQPPAGDEPPRDEPPGGDTIPQDNAASVQPPVVQPAPAANNPASSGALPSPGVAAASVSVGDPLVDYYGFLPDTNDKGKPLSTIENLAEVCRRLSITVRYNVISKEEEILIPGAGFSIDNRQNASLSWLVSECAKFRMPVDRVPEFVNYLADQNQYNPVANWITSRPWDGQDHLSDLIATVRAKGEATDPSVGAMKRAFITRWMISAVAAAFRSTGVSAHGVLVFQGVQYVGKTKWFKTLVPADLGVLKDGMLLRPDDRDSVMKCVSNWLVELGEIDATFRKSDVAALKSFLTSDRDILRRAYARKESTFARRTVFFASVNPKNYLHDETGNRRYWTIEVEHLDHSHSVDMQQCWAQVYEQLFVPGESWFLTPAELDMLNSHNEEFTVIDPIEDLITSNLRWNDPRSAWRWTTATDVLVTLGRANCSKAEVTKAGIILRKMNGDASKRTGDARLLLVPDTFKDTFGGGSHAVSR